MTSRDALAALGAMVLFLGLVGLIVKAIDGFLLRRAARRATARLCRCYWSPDMVIAVDPVLASWLRRPSTLAVALVIFASSLLAYEAVAGADCGEERAVVKLGLDRESQDGKVDPSPRDTTIEELVKLKAPRKPSEIHRANDAERTIWQVSGTVTAVKLEADQDFHIVISDGVRTMIVEVPSAECATNSAWAKEIAAVRALVEARLHPGKKVRRVDVPVTVTGVGFFDRIHGQTGVAGNGIELHPLIAVEFTGGGK